VESARIMGARAKRATVRRVRGAADAAVNLMRRGELTVIMTPPVGLRLGNLLYVWLRAHRASLSGTPTLALASRAMEPWLTAFPALNELTIRPDSLRFRDRREWDDVWLYQRFGVDFTADDVDAFVRATVAPHIVPDDSGTLVINVRRGDYYAEFIGKYAFDQVGYVGAALDRVGPAERVLVVSDDPEWCRAHLDPIIRTKASAVDYAEPDPLANFHSVARASRIIGTNSTFTYWAAYVAGVIHPGAAVVMPRFHARMTHGTDAHQLDPRWTVLDGFDSPVS
jgi:hypothetical protein